MYVGRRELAGDGEDPQRMRIVLFTLAAFMGVGNQGSCAPLPTLPPLCTHHHRAARLLRKACSR